MAKNCPKSSKNHRFSPKRSHNKAKKCRVATKMCFPSERDTQKPKFKIWNFLRKTLYDFFDQKVDPRAQNQPKSYKNHIFSSKWPYNKAKKCRTATKIFFTSERNTQKSKSKIWYFLRKTLFDFFDQKFVSMAQKQPTLFTKIIDFRQNDDIIRPKNAVGQQKRVF